MTALIEWKYVTYRESIWPIMHDWTGVVGCSKVLDLPQVIPRWTTKISTSPLKSKSLTWGSCTPCPVGCSPSLWSRGHPCSWIVSNARTNWIVIWRSSIWRNHLSALLCSCQNPVACISSCITIPARGSVIPDGIIILLDLTDNDGQGPDWAPAIPPPHY